MSIILFCCAAFCPLADIISPASAGRDSALAWLAVHTVRVNKRMLKNGEGHGYFRRPEPQVSYGKQMKCAPLATRSE